MNMIQAVRDDDRLLARALEEFGAFRGARPCWLRTGVPGNDAVCYACGATLGEHSHGEVASCPNMQLGSPLFGPSVFESAPVALPGPADPNGSDWDRFLHPYGRDEWEGEEDGMEVL